MCFSEPDFSHDFRLNIFVVVHFHFKISGGRTKEILDKLYIYKKFLQSLSSGFRSPSKVLIYFFMVSICLCESFSGHMWMNKYFKRDHFCCIKCCALALVRRIIKLIEQTKDVFKDQPHH